MSVRLGGQSLYIVRAPLIINPRNNERSRDWNNALRYRVTGCEVQDYPSVSDTEDNRNREYAEGWYQAWAPFLSTPVRPLHTDRIEWQGDVYEMRGQSRLWSTRVGRPHHWYWVMMLKVESER